MAAQFPAAVPQFDQRYPENAGTTIAAELHTVPAAASFFLLQAPHLDRPLTIKRHETSVALERASSVDAVIPGRYHCDRRGLVTVHADEVGEVLTCGYVGIGTPARADILNQIQDEVVAIAGHVLDTSDRLADARVIHARQYGGSDTDGDGSQDRPVQSLERAAILLNGADGSIQTGPGVYILDSAAHRIGQTQVVEIVGCGAALTEVRLIQSSALVANCHIASRIRQCLITSTGGSAATVIYAPDGGNTEVIDCVIRPATGRPIYVFGSEEAWTYRNRYVNVSIDVTGGNVELQYGVAEGLWVTGSGNASLHLFNVLADRVHSMVPIFATNSELTNAFAVSTKSSTLLYTGTNAGAKRRFRNRGLFIRSTETNFLDQQFLVYIIAFDEVDEVAFEDFSIDYSGPYGEAPDGYVAVFGRFSFTGEFVLRNGEIKSSCLPVMDGHSNTSVDSKYLTHDQPTLAERVRAVMTHKNAVGPLDNTAWIVTSSGSKRFYDCDIKIDATLKPSGSTGSLVEAAIRFNRAFNVGSGRKQVIDIRRCKFAIKASAVATDRSIINVVGSNVAIEGLIEDVVLEKIYGSAALENDIRGNWGSSVVWRGTLEFSESSPSIQNGINHTGVVLCPSLSATDVAATTVESQAAFSEVRGALQGNWTTGHFVVDFTEGTLSTDADGRPWRTYFTAPAGCILSGIYIKHGTPGDLDGWTIQVSKRDDSSGSTGWTAVGSAETYVLSYTTDVSYHAVDPADTAQAGTIYQVQLDSRNASAENVALYSVAAAWSRRRL